jgi:hypothetical protein
MWLQSHTYFDEHTLLNLLGMQASPFAAVALVELEAVAGDKLECEYSYYNLRLQSYIFSSMQDVMILVTIISTGLRCHDSGHNNLNWSRMS